MQKDFLDSYRSTQWQEKKNKILTRDNYTCAICGKHGDEHTLMHVHHLTYKNCKNHHAWDCPDEDLVTLCEDCHKKVHSGEPFDTASMNYAYYYGINRGKNEYTVMDLSYLNKDIQCPIVISPETGLMFFAFTVDDDDAEKYSWEKFLEHIKKLPFVFFACEDITCDFIAIARTEKGLRGLDYYKTWHALNTILDEELDLCSFEYPCNIPVAYYDYSFIKGDPKNGIFIQPNASTFIYKQTKTESLFPIESPSQGEPSTKSNFDLPDDISRHFDSLLNFKKEGAKHE